MRNDDPEYVRHLERARDDMEIEIRQLEYHIAELEAALDEERKANQPHISHVMYMGEFSTAAPTKEAS